MIEVKVIPLILACCAIGLGQSTPSANSPALPMGTPPTLVGTMSSTRLPGITVGPTVCGSDETMYFRPYGAYNKTVLRFDVAGNSLSPIVNSDPSYTIRDIAASGTNLAILLGNRTDTEAKVLVYSDAGTLGSSMQLAMPPGAVKFAPVRIVPFASGHVLVLGSQLTTSGTEFSPVGAVFAQDGTFISFLQDPTSNKPFVFGTGDELAVGSLPVTVITSDGTTAYLVRPENSVVKFNDSGVNLGEVSLQSPGAGFEPTEAGVQNGMLLISYRGATGNQFAVRYDLATGQGTVAWNHAQFEPTGNLACVAPSGDVIFRTSTELHRYSLK